MSVVVTAPLVLATNTKGQVGYFYQGATISGLSDADETRLLADGLVAPSGVAEVGVDSPADSTDISSGTKGPVPPKAGAKELWVDYAVANGWARDDAEAKTRAELIAALS